MALGLLILRLAVGFTVAAHGAQKLFGAFGGGGPRGTAETFARLRFRMPLAAALAAGAAELGGGVLLAFGFLTPFAALALMTVMLNATVTVHLRNGFFNTGGGYEYPAVLAASALALAGAGAGRYSVDALIGWEAELRGVWTLLGVLVAGAAVSAVTLCFGRSPATPPEDVALRQAA